MAARNARIRTNPASAGTVHGGGAQRPCPRRCPAPATQKVVDATGTFHLRRPQPLRPADRWHRHLCTNTQFSLEPPDQGLCVGNGWVVESMNTAIRVRNATDWSRGHGASRRTSSSGWRRKSSGQIPLVFGDFSQRSEVLLRPEPTAALVRDPPAARRRSATGAFTGHSEAAHRGERNGRPATARSISSQHRRHE